MAREAGLKMTATLALSGPMKSGGPASSSAASASGGVFRAPKPSWEGSLGALKKRRDWTTKRRRPLAINDRADNAARLIARPPDDSKLAEGRVKMRGGQVLLGSERA